MPDASPSPAGGASDRPSRAVHAPAEHTPAEHTPALHTPAAHTSADREPILQRRRFRPWAYAGWVLVGILWALSIASARSIGVFVMPVALIGTLVMCLGYTRPEAWPGSIGGLGLVGCYLAFLHRDGPGRSCTGSGSTATCVTLLNPWPFLIAGLVLITICALVSWRWYTKLITPRYRR